MVSFEKETMFKEDWMIVANGRRIPVQGIFAIIMPIMIAIAGVYIANESIKLGYTQVQTTSFLCDQGVIDPVAHTQTKCTPTWDTDSIRPGINWNCTTGIYSPYKP